MKNFIYNIAKSIVSSHETKVKGKELILEAERKKEYEHFNNVIAEYSKKYIEEAVEQFKNDSFPRFKVGEIVTTNWYNMGTRWEGTMEMLQLHTPYKGPIDVEIKSIHLDYCQIREIIDNLKERGEFDNKYTEISYTSFKKIVNGHRVKYDISWAYNIKVPNDDHEYWSYTIREHNFLKRKSDVALWSKKAYKNELKAKKLNEERELIMIKLKTQKDSIYNLM